jgi:hypothetical protein
MLEASTPLHPGGKNRRGNWENGAPANFLNVLERQRTVDSSHDDKALIDSATGMAVEMAVNQGLVEPFSGPESSLLACRSQISGGGGWDRTSDTGLMSPCWQVRRRSPPFDFPRRDAEKAAKRTVANESDRRRISGRWMLGGCSIHDCRGVQGQLRPWVSIAWSFCSDIGTSSISMSWGTYSPQMTTTFETEPRRRSGSSAA